MYENNMTAKELERALRERSPEDERLIRSLQNCDRRHFLKVSLKFAVPVYLITVNVPGCSPNPLTWITMFVPGTEMPPVRLMAMPVGFPASKVP